MPRERNCTLLAMMVRPRLRRRGRQPNRGKNGSSGHLSEPAHSQEETGISQVCNACAEPPRRVYS